MKFFPIVLFSYNRPIHLKKVLKALESSCNIHNHNIYFYNDGPKNSLDNNKIKIIKQIIKKNKKLQFTKIFYRIANIGLAKNIISGLNEVFAKNQAAIVIEDDIVLDKNAINFINFYLNKLSVRNKIGSISAYSYLNSFKKQKKMRYYLSKRHSSWAWGTWSFIWNKIDWEKLNNINIFNKRKHSIGFSKLGKDMNLLLWAQSKNYINSWAIRFNYFCYLNNLKSLQPRHSLVKNIGVDGSGTHGFFKSKNYFIKQNKRKIDLCKDPDFITKQKEIDFYIEANHKKSIKLFLLYLFSLLKNILKK